MATLDDGAPAATGQGRAACPLVVVTGTGTGIGKTWVATMLVEAWARMGIRVAGWKPIESGGTEDGDALEQVSTFHVKRFQAPYLLSRPVSPHLAAEGEGSKIDIDLVVSRLSELRAEAGAVVLELPGGLFSPLSLDATNHELLAASSPDRVVLVAPDRLGVLHDIESVLRASAVPIDAVVLTAPATADASTGTNAHELARLSPAVTIAAVIGRGERRNAGLDTWLATATR